MKRRTILMQTLSALVAVGLMLATTTTFAAARRVVRARVVAPAPMVVRARVVPRVPVVRAAVAPRVYVGPRGVVVPRHVARPVIRAGAAGIIYRGAQITVGSPTTLVAAPPELTPLPDDLTAPSTTYPVTAVDHNFTLTLAIDGHSTSVRLLGVQPLLVAEAEGQPGRLPQEAWDYVRDLLVGEQVYLANDPQVALNDAEGTRVAYVHRANDGLLANLEIIRQGFGLADEDYVYTHRDAFVGYQSQAQSLGKGIWRGLMETSPQ